MFYVGRFSCVQKNKNRASAPFPPLPPRYVRCRWSFVVTKNTASVPLLRPFNLTRRRLFCVIKKASHDKPLPLPIIRLPYLKRRWTTFCGTKQNHCQPLPVPRPYLRYRWSFFVTKNTVPPPTVPGTALQRSLFFTTRTPGVPGPPTNLCPEKNMASLATSACCALPTHHRDGICTGWQRK